MSYLTLEESPRVYIRQSHVQKESLTNSGTTKDMSAKASEVLDLLIASSPPDEIQEIAQNLRVVIPSQKSLIASSIQKFGDKEGVVLSGTRIASSLNKDKFSSKYWDYKRKEKFNIDFETGEAINVESAEPDVAYPEFYNQLVDELQSYCEEHYPTESVFEIIPQSGDLLEIIIIGNKSNLSNYYTGRWKSVYSFDSEGNVKGTISLDIHYFENGNVNLKVTEDLNDSESLGFSSASIVNYIKRAEDKLTLKVIDDFSSLNNKYFKNLRRLIPVTRSKINWGKSIGTYRLGSDVVLKK